jgi:hypothetical protein
VDLHERELAPIAALKSDPSVDDAEKNRSRAILFLFSVVEEIIWYADHLGGGKPAANIARMASRPSTGLSATC